MARYTGPKFKLDRREGTNLFLKGKRSVSGKHPLDKKGATTPGPQSKRAMRRRPSNFGLQLREKQKVKRIYGVLEKQFRRYFEEASKEKGNTGEALLSTLETRLDNVIFRLGFAPSRASARQLVNHGHVLVNNQKVNIPSFNVKTGDVITLSPKAQKFSSVAEGVSLRGEMIPSWLEVKALVGKVKRLPTSEDLDVSIEQLLIVEYYSR